MTYSDKVIIFVLVLCAFHQTVKAQSEPSHPYEGAVHTYVVNGLTPGTEYAFYISSTEDGVGVLDDGTTFEFEFQGDCSGTIPDRQSTASLPILWQNGASQHIYFLCLKLTNPGGCSVNRYLRIMPQPNKFDLLSENLPVDNTQSCPATTEIDGFNPLAAEYNAGTTLLQFKVKREGGNRAWTFEPVVTVRPEWNLDVAIVSVTAEIAGTLTADASKCFTVPATENEVLVAVAVRNYEGTEQVVTLEVRNQKEVQTQLGDCNSENDQVQHRITVIPVISDLEEL
jgi:hypothetical protein